MIGMAVLIELGCQGCDLRGNNDAKQKQNEGAPPSETRRSCHRCQHPAAFHHTPEQTQAGKIYGSIAI